ncbi:hypothetical protein TIFTF001_015385 [Ficus carica]|uniref:Uncharacterized protein n=1 Tax=Ficus carica TaxID=3494 RepID=A0AA88DIM5_FICCA|nr:hypothetical protein TIFTF001_015385 [Ficus carica]
MATEVMISGEKSRDRDLVLIASEPKPFIVIGNGEGSPTILLAPYDCFSNSVFFGDSFFSDGWVVWKKQPRPWHMAVISKNESSRRWRRQQFGIRASRHCCRPRCHLRRQARRQRRRRIDDRHGDVEIAIGGGCNGSEAPDHDVVAVNVARREAQVACPSRKHDRPMTKIAFFDRDSYDLETTGPRLGVLRDDDDG